MRRDENESDEEERVNLNHGLEDDVTSATRMSIAGQKRGRSAQVRRPNEGKPLSALRLLIRTHTAARRLRSRA